MHISISYSLKNNNQHFVLELKIWKGLLYNEQLQNDITTSANCGAFANAGIK